MTQSSEDNPGINIEGRASLSTAMSPYLSSASEHIDAGAQATVVYNGGAGYRPPLPHLG